MRSAILLATLLALATMPAAAEACPGTSPATVDTIVTPGISPTGGEGRYYFDISACDGCIGGNVWIFEESNGYDGLQRGDEDDCGLMYALDTFVF